MKLIYSIFYEYLVCLYCKISDQKICDKYAFAEVSNSVTKNDLNVSLPGGGTWEMIACAWEECGYPSHG